MSIAIAVWAAYLALMFIAAPVVFRLKVGRWPFAYAFPPRDAYTLVDWVLAIVFGVYAIWLALGPTPEPVSAWIGLLLVALGSGLQLWAMRTMGRHWRLGQDTQDESVEHVRHGPFRYVKHPIYIGMIVISIGMTLLVGFDARSFMLVLASLLYFSIQGRAETLRWSRRSE